MRIGFYGQLADVIGREIDIAAPAGGCAILDLRERIAAAYPDAAPTLCGGTVRACVNDSIVPDSHVVGPADAIEFLPPFSGG